MILAAGDNVPEPFPFGVDFDIDHTEVVGVRRLRVRHAGADEHDRLERHDGDETALVGRTLERQSRRDGARVADAHRARRRDAVERLAERVRAACLEGLDQFVRLRARHLPIDGDRHRRGGRDAARGLDRCGGLEHLRSRTFRAFPARSAPDALSPISTAARAHP